MESEISMVAPCYGDTIIACIILCANNWHEKYLMAGYLAAPPKPQAGRRRYLRLQASAVLQTVIDECSSPRTEVRGYRNCRLSDKLCPPETMIGGRSYYNCRLSGELCPMGSGALRTL